MLRKTRAAICLLLTVFLHAYPATAEEAGSPPLKVGLEDYYPPFAFTDEQGKHAGFDHEMAEALCREMNRNCDFQIKRLDELFDGICSGALDMVVAGLRITDDLTPFVDFSNHYFRSRAVYIARQGKYTLEKQHMDGKTIGVQQETMHSRYAHVHWDGVADIVEASQQQVMTMLLDGSIDIALVDGLAGYDFLKTEEGFDFEVLENPAPSDDLVNYAHIGVRKGAGNLLDEVNNALNRVWLKGEYYKINRTYFPFGIY